MNDFLKLHKHHFSFSEFLASALREDVRDGDHTSLATIPAELKGQMCLLVKQEGVIAGVDAAQRIFRGIDKTSRVRVNIKDGTTARPGQVVLVVQGRVQKLLTAERLVLNVMQRMSGIATHTARLQNLCRGTKARVIDTRKTTPNFRFFEKWAVVIGGGANHRYGLFDMVLIKDNHIDFAGGIPQAIDAASRYLKTKRKRLGIEIETRNIAEVREVLASDPVQRIMLDNFSVDETKKAVRLIGGRCEIESSGGITEENIAAYARCGVDFISVGALTHNVRSLDLSLKILR